MSTGDVLRTIELSTYGVVEAVRSIPEELHNKRENDCWTVEECIEHLIMLEQAIIGVIRGPATAVGRRIDEKIDRIRLVLGDDNRKLLAGAPVEPQGRFASTVEALPVFLHTREVLRRCAEEEDLGPERTGFAHEIFGLLTGYEWIWFLTVHAERHMRQLRRLQNGSV